MQAKLSAAVLAIGVAATKANRCGVDWATANATCGAACEFVDRPCVVYGQTCYADLSAAPCELGASTLPATTAAVAPMSAQTFATEISESPVV
ncbi:hypothetical protein HDU82_008201, partial [Entophlyctis luteolus]